MISVLSDLKHGFRVLLRTPLFTICTILALAIGIGATTALFSVVHALLIRPLPYKNADALVVMWEHNLPRNRPRNVISPANFLAWRERSRSFESMAAFTQNRVTLTGSGEPQELATLLVSANILDVLGVAPMLGRGFADGEDREGSARTMVLSHAAWLRQFGGDSRVVGKPVTIDGAPVTIVGVMPRGFEIFGLPVDAFIPFQLPAQVPFRGRSLIGLGRLKPGVTRDQAQSEMEGVFAQVTSEQPDFNTGWTINLVPLREQLVGDVRLAVLVLFGAVGAVLLIACGNIGSLMLTRASGRRRELAIRSAIGAGTGRLLTQLISESLMLSVAGGVLGIVLASWILSGMATWVGSRLPIPLLSQVSIDPMVLAFAAIVTVMTTMICGLAPAIGATGGSLVTALRDGAPSVSGSRRGRMVRQSFVMAEIALRAGRDVTDADLPDREPVAVINETFARQIYPGDNPIGRRFILILGNEKPHEIIGVVGDVKLVTLEGEIRPTAYLSSRQYAFGVMNFVVRTTGDPARLGPAAVRVIREIDPLLPVSAVRPLEDVFAESIARPRLTAVAMGIFAGAALLLAALGVYGIVAYSVAQRAREFGIRVALGAQPGQIISMVVGQNLRIVGLGLGAGILAAIPATRLLRGLLFQVGPNDPMTFVVIGVMLAGVAIVASYLPARRGTRVDPVVTLKAE